MHLVKNIVNSGQTYWYGDSKDKTPVIKIDKAATLLEARAFNDNHIDINKCLKTLGKLIYLFSQG